MIEVQVDEIHKPDLYLAYIMRIGNESENLLILKKEKETLVYPPSWQLDECSDDHPYFTLIMLHTGACTKHLCRETPTSFAISDSSEGQSPALPSP